jgi:hypothetical protein
MVTEFIQVWALSLISIAITSTIATIFVLVSTGFIQHMSPNEKGELRSFSFIVMGIWSIGASLVLTQIIFLLT